MVSIFGLGIGQIILIVGVVLVISFFFFRRYFSALIYDYGVDGLLSFIDVGTPIGDLIAAFLIYNKYKKIVGSAWAIFLVLESLNFIIGLVPVVGAPVELFTNLFPTVFLTVFLFNKFRPAEKKERELEKEVSIAEQLGIKVSKEKKVLEDVKKLIRKSDPVDALKELKSKKPVKEVSSKLRDYVDSLVSDTNNIVQYIVGQKVQAPQELINILQEGINEAGQLLQQAQEAEENEDFETAINSATNANSIIRAAAQQFDSAFQQYQAELQNQQLQPGYAY